MVCEDSGPDKQGTSMAAIPSRFGFDLLGRGRYRNERTDHIRSPQMHSDSISANDVTLVDQLKTSMALMFQPPNALMNPYPKWMDRRSGFFPDIAPYRACAHLCAPPPSRPTHAGAYKSEGSDASSSPLNAKLLLA